MAMAQEIPRPGCPFAGDARADTGPPLAGAGVIALLELEALELTPGAVVAVIADDEAGTAHRLFGSGAVRGRPVLF
nr:hypothetical protein [Streptomyces acidiscabies]